jgi:hypothetical protein
MPTDDYRAREEDESREGAVRITFSGDAGPAKFRLGAEAPWMNEEEITFDSEVDYKARDFISSYYHNIYEYMEYKKDLIASDIARELSKLSGQRVANVSIDFRRGSLLWEGAITILAVIGGTNTIIQFCEYSSKLYPYIINKIIGRYITTSDAPGSASHVTYKVTHPNITTQTLVQLPFRAPSPSIQYVVPKEIYINVPNLNIPSKPQNLPSYRLVMILLSLNVFTILMIAFLMLLFFLMMR